MDDKLQPTHRDLPATAPPATSRGTADEASLPAANRERRAPVLLMPPPLVPAPPPPPVPSPKRRGSRVAIAAAAGIAIAGVAWLLRARPEPPVDLGSEIAPKPAVETRAPVTPPASAERLVSPDAEPRVERSADGEYRLALPAQLWGAVDAFLASRPVLRLAQWSDAGVDSRTEMESGRMQYPFALWRDLDEDGDEDVALVFASTVTVDPTWSIVAFRASPDGRYDDVTVTTMIGCFDGMLYVPRFRHVEFGCFEVAVGAFSWNGRGFSVQEAMGD